MKTLAVDIQTVPLTYADYLRLPESERWEIIDGKAYAMTPAPSRQHQSIARELLVQIATFLKSKKCKVYAAPFDVRLSHKKTATNEGVNTVVQPDIIVACDLHKLDNRGCNGAPDLVIEIISPESAVRDLKTKLHLYEIHGVKEYWIVSPFEQIVWVYNSVNGTEFGKPQIFAQNDLIETAILSGIEIRVEEIFQE